MCVGTLGGLSGIARIYQFLLGQMCERREVDSNMQDVLFDHQARCVAQWPLGASTPHGRAFTWPRSRPAAPLPHPHPFVPRMEQQLRGPAPPGSMWA